MPATWKRLLTTDDITSENIGNTDLTSSASRSFTIGHIGNLKVISNNSTELLTLNSGVDAASDSVQISGSTFQLKSSVGSASINFRLLEADDNGSNYVQLNAPTSISSNFTLTLPDSDGTNGQALVTDGSGNLSFSTVSGSGTIDGTGAANKIAIWSDADTLTNDTDLSWSSSTNTLSSVNLTATGSVNCDILNADEIQIAKQPGTNAAGAYDGAGSRVFNKIGGVTTPVNPAGKVFILQGSGSGTWVAADKDAEATSTGLLAVWPNTGGPSKMLAEGTVLMASNSGWSTAVAGAPLYLADDGAVKSAPPSDSGDIARIVGYVLNAASRIMYFRPDPTFVKIA